MGGFGNLSVSRGVNIYVWFCKGDKFGGSRTVGSRHGTYLTLNEDLFSSIASLHHWRCSGTWRTGISMTLWAGSVKTSRENLSLGNFTFCTSWMICFNAGISPSLEVCSSKTSEQNLCLGSSSLWASLFQCAEQLRGIPTGFNHKTLPLVTLRAPQEKECVSMWGWMTPRFHSVNGAHSLKKPRENLNSIDPDNPLCPPHSNTSMEKKILLFLLFLLSLIFSFLPY